MCLIVCYVLCWLVKMAATSTKNSMDSSQGGPTNGFTYLGTHNTAFITEETWAMTIIQRGKKDFFSRKNGTILLKSLDFLDIT
jgi:hypothetical protein